MEIDDKIYKKITDLTDKANALYNKGEYTKGIEIYKKALELVPEPKYIWDATCWINLSIADNYFMMQDYKNALIFFSEAYKSGGGITNPFVLFRTGQIYHLINDEKNAKEFLLRAYMVDGYHIFKEIDESYFNIIKDII